MPQVKGRAAPKFDSYLLALEAAMDGQGIAIAPHFLVAGDLKSGRLVKPFRLEVPQPRRWYLVCRKERRSEPRIARFRDWLIGADRSRSRDAIAGNQNGAAKAAPSKASARKRAYSVPLAAMISRASSMWAWLAARRRSMTVGSSSERQISLQSAMIMPR